MSYKIDLAIKIFAFFFFLQTLAHEVTLKAHLLHKKRHHAVFNLNIPHVTYLNASAKNSAPQPAPNPAAVSLTLKKQDDIAGK